MQKSERVNFGSKIGAILAAAGSAVGLDLVIYGVSLTKREIMAARRSF